MHSLNQFIKRVLGFSLLLSVILITACGGGTSSSSPKIIAVDPVDGSTSIAINSKVIATFDKNMNAKTIDDTSFTLIGEGEAALTGIIKFDDYSRSVSFSSDSNFTADTVYTATLTSAVKGKNTKSLKSDYVWSFTSGTEEDMDAPTVNSTIPVDNATGVAINRSISAFFSESLNPASINLDTFKLTSNAGNTSVSGKVSYENKLVSFKPNSNLAINTLFTATLTTAVEDLAGNTMDVMFVWTFTSGDSTATGPAPVNLRTAGNFVILSKTGITNVHTSDITGDIGASPITATAMNNVFCTEIDGTIYGANDAYVGSGLQPCFAGSASDNTLVANAVLDMGTAYTDAAGRTNPDYTELHAGDLSGKTLAPGLYKWGTDVLINTDVTLSGDANDVWIFQISGDLIQASNTSVILAGGARAKNIFWQVGGGTGVALDTGADFEGVVLAIKGITVNTLASVNGRLLSQTAVTLDMNTVTEPNL